MTTECGQCSDARALRRRVMRNGDELRPELTKDPFDTAPALYAYNIPRYYTMLVRAREFAKRRQLHLSWTVAYDIPLHHDDRELSSELLHAKRCRWLQSHDQYTSHITSLLPLVVGLPIRLTENIDRKRSLFRGRRGFIVNWAVHPDGSAQCVNEEWILDKSPPAVYIFSPELLCRSMLTSA